MGKTTFALSIADYIAAVGSVLFVSLEMDINQLRQSALEEWRVSLPASF